MIGTSFFGLLRARERWLGARFTALAQNVANADTPGYRARDLDPADFARRVEGLARSRTQVAPVRTHPRHLPAGDSLRLDLRARPRAPVEDTVSGNTVVLADEVRRLAEVEEQYRLALRLFGKYRDMFRSAIRLQI